LNDDAMRLARLSAGAIAGKERDGDCEKYGTEHRFHH